MKVETRGKYPGVKIHLDEEEAQYLLDAANDKEVKAVVAPVQCQIPLSLAINMGQKIRTLLAENPDLLKPRTPEQIKAILVKEAEKSKLQLETLNKTGQFKELDKEALKKQLLNYVKD